MNSLNNLSDAELLLKLHELVKEERRLTAEVLTHLLEVENRRLFLSEGYPSLYEYAVKALHYSESGAFRRISAMRLMKKIPEIKNSINQGTLTLSKLTQAQAFFKQENRSGIHYDSQSQREILSRLETKSSRECEKYFAGLAPQNIPRDKERVITENQTEIRFVASDALLEKLDLFKKLNSHAQTNPSYAEVFEYLVDLALKKKDPNLKKSRMQKSGIQKSDTSKIKTTSPSTSKVTEITKLSFHSPAAKPNLAPTSALKNNRLIPAKLKQKIWERDEAKCSYLNHQNHKCGSTFQLQIDHIIPVAAGGSSEESNLRLLCRSHNLGEARRIFGAKHMEKFEKVLH